MILSEKSATFRDHALISFLANGETVAGARKDTPRRLAMVGPDMGGNEPDGGCEHGRIVGEADHWQHVGDQIERQDEIAERCDQNELDATRRVAIEGAEIGREQVLGKGQICRKAPELWPKLASDAGLLLRGRAADITFTRVVCEPDHPLASGPPWLRG